MPFVAPIIIVIFRIALYLGVGALMHALFVSTQFDFSSALTWGWLLAWPLIAFVMVLSFLGLAGIAILVLFLIGAVFLTYYSKLQGWVRRRRNARILRGATRQR